MESSSSTIHGIIDRLRYHLWNRLVVLFVMESSVDRCLWFVVPITELSYHNIKILLSQVKALLVIGNDDDIVGENALL